MADGMDVNEDLLATAEVEDTEDGGALLTVDNDDVSVGPGSFYDNLCSTGSPGLQDNIRNAANSLFDKYSKDKSNKKERDDSVAKSVKRTGLSEAADGAQFDGASLITHPGLIEASLDYSTRVMQELFPLTGPVKQKIVGGMTSDKSDRAIRIARWMNHQLLEVSSEFKDEIEQGVAQQPLSGAFYVKVYWDSNTKAPKIEVIPSDHIVLPSRASSFRSSYRRGHYYDVASDVYEERVANGIYASDAVISPSSTEENSTEEEMNKATKVVRDTENYDEMRTLVDIYAKAKLEDEYGNAPYIFTLDDQSGNVVSVQRNWMENDPTKTEIEHIVEFPFMRFRGVYALSLGDIIGSLSGAATGALRSLLDAAHISNHQGFLKLKKGGGSGRSYSTDPTQVVEVEGMEDDIRKVAMPVSPNPPSPVMLQLLTFITDQMRGVVRTSMEDTTQSNTEVPVGTQMSRVEEGTRTFKTLFRRQWDSMSRVFGIVYRLNGQYITDDIIIDQAGEQIAKAEDFKGPCSVLPTADPNIYTEAQRFSQTQGLIARATNNPLYNPIEVEEKVLRQLRYSEEEISKLLRRPPKPEEMNSVNENMAMTMGRPVVAFPMQNHLAHIQDHLSFLESPLFGSSPIAAPVFIPAVLEHLKQHLSFWYVTTVVDLVQNSTNISIKELINSDDPNVKGKLDVLFAAASTKVISDASSDQLKDVPQVIIKAMDTLRQFAPPAPMDPVMVQAKAIDADLQKEKMRLDDKQKDRDNRQIKEDQDRKADAEKFAAQLKADMDELLTSIKVSNEQSKDQARAAIVESTNEFKNNILNLVQDLIKSREANATSLQLAMLKDSKDSEGNTIPADVPDQLRNMVESVVKNFLANTERPSLPTPAS